MPILSKNDKLIKKINLPEGLGLADVQRLPDISSLSPGDLQHPAARQGLESLWSATSVQNYSILAQKEAGQIISTIGIPSDVGVFDNFIDLIKVDDIAAEVLGAVVNAVKPVIDKPVDAIAEVVQEALSIVIKPLVDFATSIPVLGWVLDLVIGIVKIIVFAVKTAKHQNDPPPPKEYDMLLFNPDTDALLADYIAIQLFSEGPEVNSFGHPTGQANNPFDWTRVFRPVKGPKGYKFWWAKIREDQGGGARVQVRTSETIGGGGAFGPLQTVHSDVMVGHIPGTQRLDGGGIQTGQHGTGAHLIGKLYPSMGQASIQLWDKVGAEGGPATPALWTVNAYHARNEWEAYLDALRREIKNGPSYFKIRSDTKKKLIHDGVKWYGWKKDKLDYDNTHPAKALNKLIKRQRKYARTTLAAYARLDSVHKSGIANHWYKDDYTIELLEKTRRVYVESYPASMLIDTASIPDPIYRAHVESTQEKARALGYTGSKKRQALGVKRDIKTIKALPAGGFDDIDMGKVAGAIVDGAKRTKSGDSMGPMILAAGAIGLLMLKGRK